MARQPSYTSALRKALADRGQQPVDGAAVRLAHGYAAQLDAPACSECGGPGDRLDRLGPKLLAALDALGMTPRGRVAVTGKGAQDHGPAASPLDELRDRRAARQHRTASVDSAAP